MLHVNVHIHMTTESSVSATKVEIAPVGHYVKQYIYSKINELLITPMEPKLSSKLRREKHPPERLGGVEVVC